MMVLCARVLELAPWGAYCEKLYAFPSADMMDRKVDLINPATG